MSRAGSERRRSRSGLRLLEARAPPARRAAPALRAAPLGPSPPGRRPTRPATGAPSPSSRSRAPPRRTAPQHLRLVRRRLRQHRVQRHDERLRQLLRKRQHVLPVARHRRSRTRAGAARRRHRAAPASAPSGRSRRARPARSSRARPAAAGSTVRSRPRRDRRPSTRRRRAASLAGRPRRLPIPHARGGYVETIAVRTAPARYGRTPSRLIRCGSCRPPRTAVLLRNAPLVVRAAGRAPASGSSS